MKTQTWKNMAATFWLLWGLFHMLDIQYNLRQWIGIGIWTCAIVLAGILFSGVPLAKPLKTESPEPPTSQPGELG